ncbi:hypothetical protein M0R72_09655 [Candidatus Pacearchaeota archaeon]|jgi:hypothetical protein|nr:hypothetical protein [Candidatus Pacearchaeota archaeon]
MKINKNIFGIILLFGILSLTFVSAYSSSTAQLSQYDISTAENIETSCGTDSDFIIQLEPFGCTPSVITSDLLEENDVPVFCKLAVTKINPLIKVNSIESVSITGNLSSDVSGVAYYPAKAALDTGTTLTTSVLENIGYVVINLKQHANASSMPDSVSGDLTATIEYDVDDALGLGDGVYHVPELNEEDWEAKKSLYQFWSGKGVLKVESIDGDEATISVYDAADDKIATVTLAEGDTSNTIYIPSVGCGAGVKLKLADLENPDTRVQLMINNEIIEVAEGEKFLDNKCSVKEIEKSGLVQKVTIRCQEDEETNTFSLIISPKILLDINGENKEVGVGDYLYEDEKGNNVYLGYVGIKGDADEVSGLFAYLVSMPGKTSDTLTESEISSFNLVAGDLIESQQEGSGIIDGVSDVLKKIAGLSNRLSRWVANGQRLYRINYGATENVFGSQVSVKNYAGSTDVELDENYLESYEVTKETYQQIIDQYTSEVYSGDLTYGEKALYSEISLAYSANQKNTAAELCEEAKNNYPDSAFLPSICKYVYKLSSDNSDEESVEINNNIKTISLEGISEPTYEEYGVDLTVVNHLGVAKTYKLAKGKIVYLDETGGEYVQLSSITNESSAQIKVNVEHAGVMSAIKSAFGSDTIKLEEDVSKELGDYSFTLNEVYIEKTAKISITSTINDAGTKANFSFEIGIEQRAITLSPDEIKDKLEDLNDSIEEFTEISDNLGEIVTGLKTSCLATGVILITKNFISGLGNAGTARQYVMRGAEGWFEKCADLVNNGTYSSTDSCLNENSDTIDEDVDALTNLINEQNDKIEALQESATTTQFLSEDVVNTDAFMKDYTEQVSEELSSNLDNTITDPSGKGETISASEVIDTLTYDSWKSNYYSTEDLRNIELYSNILSDSSSSDELKTIAEAELYSELSDVMAASENAASRSKTADEAGVDVSNVVSFETGKDVKKLSYTGLTNSDLGIKKISAFSDATPVQIIQTYPKGDKYILILENSVGTSNYYIKNVNNALQIYGYNDLTITTSQDLTSVYFVKYDSSSYENEYKDPELSYYETEPYAGLPAIVPFDTKDGWYAATKQTIATAGNIQTYDASGTVNSFYLCNVGVNGMEEFYSSGYGDDECILINTGTGQSYDQVPGMSESDAEKLVKCALSAIEQASEAYPATGKVKISTNCGSATINVGEPAVDIPDYACQDFMSPNECLLLFNLCDPVICPSSRCDLGGTYPVSDVVQSGIIGSIVLCLPNYKEKIMIPVCLTGIKAGIDSFLSVQKSYRDCLQEALDSGELVGVCDEIYSIYLCEFFWEQTLPLAEMVIPKLIESFLGQNLRGGGEYLSVQDSLDNTENSISYFSNYYGTNVKEAFTTQVKEVIQSEVCQSFVSGSSISTADLIDSLTAADSPVQYYGKFEETSLTTVTSPALSHYKVYYHIYAGEEAGSYYQVYLQGTASGSYYQDTSSTLAVASGYVNVGGYATETKDFTGVSGYDELCISINGAVECGFKSVTTSFAIDYATDEYLSSQANVTGITSQEECISGTTSLYNLLNLNLQSGVESTIDPAIYTQGIIRVCATSSPGKGTDPDYDNEDARWIDVGYCDDEELDCWIDTESVKDVVEAVNIENETLTSLSDLTIEALQAEGEFLTESEFSSVIKEIENEPDSSNKIVLVDNIFENAFWSYQKAKLLLLKADAYFNLFTSKYKGNVIEEETETTEGTSTTTTGSVTYNVAISNVKEDSLTTAQKNVLAATKNLVGTSASRDTYSNCWDAAYQSYRNAKVGDSCAYSDADGKSYTIANEKCTSGNCKSATITTVLATENSPTFAVYSNCLTSSSSKLGSIQTGDMLSYVWRNDAGHSAIFIGWKDEANEIAYLFDWNGGSSGNRVFRYYEEDLSDDKHPVYVYWRATSNEETSVAKETIANLPADDQSDFVETEEETSTESISYQIFAEAVKLLNKQIDSMALVRTALSNAGTGISSASENGVSVATLNLLMNDLESNENFVEINTGTLEVGDVVFLGKGCSLPLSVGIFGYSVETKNPYYSNIDGEIAEETTNNIFSISSSEYYIYKAYRYVGDKYFKIVTERTIEDLDSAIENIEGGLTGDYADNKQFVDNLIFDGVLTEEQCEQIIPTNVFGLNIGSGMKISEIKDFLLVNQLEQSL